MAEVVQYLNGQLIPLLEPGSNGQCAGDLPGRMAFADVFGMDHSYNLSWWRKCWRRNDERNQYHAFGHLQIMVQPIQADSLRCPVAAAKPMQWSMRISFLQRDLLVGIEYSYSSPGYWSGPFT